MSNCTSLNAASANNFQLVIPKLPHTESLDESREFILNVYGTILPGVSLDAEDHHWQGWASKRLDGKMNFTDVTMNFSVNEKFSNWITLFDWMSFINNNKDVMSGHPREYTVDAFLLILNNFGNTILRCKYVNLVPIDIDAVTLSFREGEPFLESGCTFTYDRFEIERDNFPLC